MHHAAAGSLHLQRSAFTLGPSVSCIGLKIPNTDAGGLCISRQMACITFTFYRSVVSCLVPDIPIHLIATRPNHPTVDFTPYSLTLFAVIRRLLGGRLGPPDKLSPRRVVHAVDVNPLP